MRTASHEGEVFGRLTILRKDTLNEKSGKWICRCTCGVEKSIWYSNLIRGMSKSCGCLQKEEQSNRQGIDRTGLKSGRLTAIKRNGFKGEQLAWLCKCDCGNTVTISGYEFGSGGTLSCGCLQKERTAESLRTHGMSSSREYRSWLAMRQRCTNDKRDNWMHYGGKGITICQEWMDSFENFYSSMGPIPSDRHSIERNDTTGNYEPGNCRWATPTEQMRNTTKTKKLSWDGKIVSIAELSEITGIPYTLLQGRLASGWSVDDAVNRPKRNH